MIVQPELTAAEYHAHPALSATKIKLMATGTALDFWDRYDAPENLRTPFVPTEAMRQGSLVDCLITQPEQFGKLYAIVPDDAPKKPTSTQINAKKPSEATLEAIAWWEDFRAAAKGKEIISTDWHITALEIRQRLMDDPEIGPILKADRVSQKPHFFEDAETGLQCRYMPDIENENLIDLKKAASAHPRHFNAQLYKLGYDIQLAHYREGYQDRNDGKLPANCGFIAYEWKKPYNCSLCLITHDYIEVGIQRRADAIRKIEECRNSGLYPSWGRNLLAPPSYAELDAADYDNDLDDLGLDYTA